MSVICLCFYQWCYGLNCVSQISYMEILPLSTKSWYLEMSFGGTVWFRRVHEGRALMVCLVLLQEQTPKTNLPPIIPFPVQPVSRGHSDKVALCKAGRELSPEIYHVASWPQAFSHQSYEKVNFCFFSHLPYGTVYGSQTRRKNSSLSWSCESITFCPFRIHLWEYLSPFLQHQFSLSTGSF